MAAHGDGRGGPSAIALAALALVLAAASSAAGEVCLPSLAEEGRRLPEMPVPSVC